MKLIALLCPVCGQRLVPDADEAVVISCGNCATAVSLTDQGIATANVQYAAPSDDTAGHWLPLWQFNATVNFTQRDTQGGSSSAREAAARFWAEPRRLYVPAWSLPVSRARKLGASLVQAQPVFRAVDRPQGAQLQTAVVNTDDALKLLEFVILSLEAQRDDWLKAVEFTIDAGPPQLWAIPARHDGGDRWTLLAATAET